ncbi:MAG: hypothetical protein EBX28_08945 [Betaproteobacteria bacterium]|nr:hypothetical protein [Betaproteobacteria bacterium]
MMKTAQSRMRGAAVIAAMLVVAIAASLAAQVFERQQLSVRSIENRMDASQIRWIDRLSSCTLIFQAWMWPRRSS